MLRQQDNAFLGVGANEVVSRVNSKASHLLPTEPHTLGRAERLEVYNGSCEVLLQQTGVLGGGGILGSQGWGMTSEAVFSHPSALAPLFLGTETLSVQHKAEPAVCPVPCPPSVAAEKQEGQLLSDTFQCWSSQETHDTSVFISILNSHPCLSQ